MTTPHRTLQMALDALDAITDDVDGTGLNTMPSFDKALDAIAALREALAAPEPEPVARVAEVHMSRYTIEWTNGPLPEGTGLYAAPPAAPALPDGSRDILERLSSAPPAAPAPDAPVPDGWVMVPREPTPEMLAVVRNGPMHETWTEGYCAMIAASPAAPVVPLTDEQIRSMWKSSEFRGNGGQVDWFCEGIRAAEAHHRITGASK